MTLGARGCVLVSDDESLEVHSHRVHAVDTVGAGDAFCGALGTWMSSGASLREALVFANAAGALAVTRFGAEPAMPMKQDIVDLAANARLVAAAAEQDRYATS
jgi:ribokinase